MNPQFTAHLSDFVNRAADLPPTPRDTKEMLANNPTRNTEDTTDLLLCFPFIEIELNAIILSASEFFGDNLTNLL